MQIWVTDKLIGQVFNEQIGYGIGGPVLSVNGSNLLDFDLVLANPVTGVFLLNQTFELEMKQLDFETGFTC